jgi:hypothetical protein
MQSFLSLSSVLVYQGEGVVGTPRCQQPPPPDTLKKESEVTGIAYWLLKTEPGEYSYSDLEQAGRDVWDGVKNFAAL